MQTEIYLQAVIFIASVLLGALGFGNSMIALPFMLFMLDARLAIPVMKIISFFCQLFLVAFYRFSIDRQLLIQLVIPTIIGALGGAWLLQNLDTVLLVRLVMVVIISFSCMTLLFGRKLNRLPDWTASVVGLIAGVLGGSVALSGPPVVLFLSHEHANNKDAFRGTVMVYFFLEISITLIIYAIYRIFTVEQWLLALRLVPISLLGIWLGVKVFNRFSNESFRTIVLVSLVGLCAVTLFTH